MIGSLPSGVRRTVVTGVVVFAIPATTQFSMLVLMIWLDFVLLIVLLIVL